MKMTTGRRGVGGGGWGWLVMFAVVSALCVSGPALYWKFNHHPPLKSSTLFLLKTNTATGCPVCNPCKCPPPPSLLQIAPGLSNLSIPDCGSTDPDLQKEMAKQFVDLLTEELKLQESVASERSLHMNLTLSDAKRVASQYQREADKCVAATETCEAARERSESFLRKERKLTLLWERRARKLGWEAA